MQGIEQIMDSVAELADPGRSVTVLAGGLTNANHKVVTATGSYVVRRWSEDSGLLAIDRDNEFHNSVRAAEAGVGARVVAYLPEHNTMVMRWLVDDAQVARLDLEHVEVVAEAARAMQAPAGAGHLLQQRASLAQRPRAEGLALEPLHHHRVVLGQVGDDGGADADLGRAHRVLVLVVAVDREQAAVVAPPPHDVAPGRGHDLVVGVGEAARERAHRALAGAQLRDLVHDLLELEHRPLPLTRAGRFPRREANLSAAPGSVNRLSTRAA